MAHQVQNACILLAAGRSARMGKDKLRLPYKGKSIFETCVDAIGNSPFSQKIVVGYQSKVSGFEAIYLAGPSPLMHFSLRAGVLAIAPAIEYFCVALADQPQLTPKHFHDLLGTWEQAKKSEKDLVLPVNEAGERGTPSLIHIRYLPEILSHADDDRGCHYLFEHHPEKVFRWLTPEKAYFFDIDTPEDYECATSNS